MNKQTNMFEALPEDWESAGIPRSIPERLEERHMLPVVFQELQMHREDSPMVEFLQLGGWDYFVTITARHCLTLASARRVAQKVCDRIDSAGGWQREHCSPDYSAGRLFWVAEPHKHAAQGYHLHCLLKLPFPRFTGWTKKRKFLFILNVARRAVGGAEWHNNKGDIGLWHRTDIQDWKGKKQAEYVTKYLQKSIADWDTFRIL